MNAPISTLKENPNNPRFIRNEKFEKLVKSIREFPEMLNLRPIVVNADMVVLGGNMRLKAAQEIGLTEVPIMIANLTPEQEREFVIKDNASFGEWDWDALANDWSDHSLDDWGVNFFQTDFEPSTNPTASGNKVTDSDIENAENNQGNRPTAAGHVETICPHCGETFNVML